MKLTLSRAIAAAAIAATIAASCMLVSCEGRRMSNMTPAGDTVEVVPGPSVEYPDSI